MKITIPGLNLDLSSKVLTTFPTSETPQTSAGLQLHSKNKKTRKLIFSENQFYDAWKYLDKGY